MDSFMWVIPVIITVCYFKIMGMGVRKLNKDKHKMEKRALLIFTFIILTSTIVFFVPIGYGIHKNFALGGLIVAGFLGIFLAWIGVIKYINQGLYEKSAGVLEKFLKLII
ncbi:hypothetical protein FZC76_14770 [Sutcliffiella horikoshii]|uniref:Uncharacterized protein n=1 Tax=Sutcliffiella horikoshii TaxID=79883 RepID=A0A5D4SXY5_9BACI|nr:hypothetical protein [Sutcliffiella horikoshii]TYS67819.1 hypothetical protein FZC76_14770 [Sutcliffiella horikoshii]